MSKKLFLTQLIISFVYCQQNTTIKIADQIVTQNLQHYFFQIPQFTDFTLFFWFRIIQIDTLYPKPTILTIKNQNDIKTINFKFDSPNNKLFLVDEYNSTQYTGWQIPIRNSLQDIEQKAVLFDEWLPIIITRVDSTDTIIFRSYDNLSQHQYMNKGFKYQNGAIIFFRDSNLDSSENFLYQDLYITNFSVQNIVSINEIIYGYKLLGAYSYEARSNNKQIYYNQQQLNEHKNSHMYFEQITSLPYNDLHFQNTYKLYLPNYYQNNVFYLCQFYIEFQILFQNNWTSLDNTLVKQYTVYQRNVISSGLQFNHTLSFQILQNNTNDYTIEQKENFYNGSMDQNIDTKQLSFLSQMDNFTLNRPSIMLIRSYPQSGFIRLNEIEFRLIQYQFRVNKIFTADFSYGYYDQVTQYTKQENNLDFVIGSFIYKIIIYQGLDVIDIITNGDIEYNFGNQNQIFLKKVGQNLSQMTKNYNPNSLTEVLFGIGIQENSVNQSCQQIVPNCSFCVDFQCLNCSEDYYLANGKCLLCDTTYTGFNDMCIENYQVFFTDKINTGLNYDQNYYRMHSIVVQSQNQRNAIQSNIFRRKLIINDVPHSNILKSYFTNFFSIQKLRVAAYNIFYVSGFKPSTFAYCQNTKYFRISLDFYVECVDTCKRGEHIEQNRICVKNFEGCETQNELQCLKCEEGYDQSIIDNLNSVSCIKQYIQINTVENLSTFNVSLAITLANCLLETSDQRCLLCATGYILNIDSQTCTLETAEFQKIKTNKNCSKYDSIINPSQCVGTWSPCFQSNSTQKKWISDCSSYDTFQHTCSGCGILLSATALNYTKVCANCALGELLSDYCAVCESNQITLNGYCFEKLCANLNPSCTSCDTNNLISCSNCATGYTRVLKQNNFYDCVKNFINCTSHQNLSNQLKCISCAAGYILLNEDNLIDTVGNKCILQQNYVENCNEYQYTTNYLCTKCNTGYTYVNGMNACILESKIVQNCNTYDVQLQICILCNQGYNCLNSQYQLSTIECKFCLDNQMVSAGCQQYSKTLQCIGCLPGYECLDQNFIQSTTGLCDQCAQVANIIQDCLQYDANGFCVQCQNGFLCVDLQMQYSTIQCDTCIQEDVYSSNCFQLDMIQGCQACLQNYFLALHQNKTVCIQEQNRIANCDQHVLDLSQQLICILCYENFFVSDGICTFCQPQIEIYVSTQQVCIYQDMYIENCAFYNFEQICLQCEPLYQLYQIQKDNYVQNFCGKEIISNCEFYENQEKCKQCYNQYYLYFNLNLCLTAEQCQETKCFLPDQQQKVYEQVLDNCLVQVQDCLVCDPEDNNICFKCQENYKLQNKQCNLDCSSNDLDLQQKNSCQQVNEQYIFDFQNICSVIYQNCEECQYNNNIFTCIKCQYNYIYRDSLCVLENSIYQLPDCKFPCLQCLNEICLQCELQFIVKDGVCVSTQSTLQNKVQCQDQVICYKEGQEVNMHCSQCKNSCLLQISNYVIQVPTDIQLYTNIKQENPDYFIQFDYIENQLKIVSKDQFKTVNIDIESKKFFNNSVNCLPFDIYRFTLQPVQFDKSIEVYDQTQQIQQLVPKLSMLLNSETSFSIYLLLNELNIFLQFDYLGITQGKFLTTLINRKNMNLQISQNKIIQNYFQKDYYLQYLIVANQIDISFFEKFINSIKSDFFVLIITIGFYSLAFIFCFSLQNLKQYGIQVKNVLFQYIFCKSTQFLLGLLQYCQEFFKFTRNRSTNLLYIFLLNFVMTNILFSCIYRIYKNYKKTQFLNKKKSNIKELVNFQKKTLNNWQLILRMCFLFFKLKFLYDFKDNKNISVALFLLTSLIELFKYSHYIKHKFTLPIFFVESLYILGMIVLTLLYVLQFHEIIKLHSLIYDIFFVSQIVAQASINLVSKIIFFKHRNTANQVLLYISAFVLFYKITFKN